MHPFSGLSGVVQWKCASDKTGNYAETQEFGIGKRKANAGCCIRAMIPSMLQLKSEPQCLHFLALARMVSAQ